MWGTLNPLPFFTGGSQPAPAQRYILTHNGVNSYVDTGSINYSIGDNIKFKASLPSNQNTFPCVIGDTTNSLLVRCTSGGKVELRGATGTVNGVQIVSNTTDWPNTGGDFDLTLTVSGEVRRLAARSDSLVGFFGGYIYDFQDSMGNNFPIDDNSTTVIRNTGSGADATPINVTPSMWSLVNV